MFTAVFALLLGFPVSASPIVGPGDDDKEALDAFVPLHLSTPRVNCTATLTTGGNVFVAGGLTKQTSLTATLATAEIVDPSYHDGEGRVSPPFPLAGKLFASRAFHDAVRRSDGAVFLVGGDVAGSIELYDPSKGVRGECRTLGVLLHGPRFGLTATLLPDGRIFIAGGAFANQKPTAKTEIFDPKTNKSVAGPDLSEPRLSHTATLLVDGRVLIAGGVGRRSTDLFDPKAMKLVRGPDLTTVRDDHRATRLSDGRVLITAGQDEKARVQASAEIFDPLTLRCRATGSLAVARADHCQVLLADGRVVVLGGESDDGHDDDEILASVEVFDPLSLTFSKSKSLAVARDDAAAVVLPDQRVLVVGGQTTGDVAVSSVEFLKP